jgi:hypothetical protein
VFIKEGISMTDNQLIWLPSWHIAFMDFLKKGLVLKFASLYGLSNLEWISLNQLWYIFLSTAVTPIYVAQLMDADVLHANAEHWVTNENHWLIRTLGFSYIGHILLPPITYRHINRVFPWKYTEKNTHISLSHNYYFPVTSIR